MFAARFRPGSRLRALVAALALVAAPAVRAQAIQQSGAVVPFHAPVFFQNGVVGDGGTPQSPFVQALGIFGGANCPLGVSSQTGPGQSTTPAGLFTVCQTLTTTTLVIAGVNGASTPTFFVNIGGVDYPFPGSGSGNVVGPVSSTTDDYACWNNTAGTLLKDCGVPSVLTANSLLGNATGSSAVPAAVAVPSCSSANQALIWTAGVGLGCQTIAGTGSVTSVATGAGLTGGPITSTGTISATEVTNAQTGTTYTVLVTDNQGIVTLNNSGSIAVTLPQATGSFGAGWATTICDIGAGTATITPTTSTIGGASTYVLTQASCVSPVSDGSNYAAVPYQGQKAATFTTENATVSRSLNGVLTQSATPPTIASGFGTSPSIVNSNGTVAFTVNVGTSNTGTGVLTFPAAPHGWACAINDITTKSTTVATTQVTATGTTSLTVQNYTDIMGTHAWVDSDVLQFSGCSPY